MKDEKATLPDGLRKIKAIAERAIQPIRPADKSTVAPPKFLFTAQRTEASRDLPAYYLIYFLLLEILGFRNLGKFEKIAWSVPIDFEGRAFLVEHRKFGVGIFAEDPASESKQADQIASLICRGTKVARPFFDWLAEKAIEESKLNVVNRSRDLYSCFEYFRAGFLREMERNADSPIAGIIGTPLEAAWLSRAAIEAFFGWTEHIFVHLAILVGVAITGDDVAELADSEWKVKFGRVFDLQDPETSKHYNTLLEIRRQMRNHAAHGAFGKDGEAFSFHSSAGAVPVHMAHHRTGKRFALGSSSGSKESEAIGAIDDFIGFLWTGPREPARHYLETSLPTILTESRNGTYSLAMSSMPRMEEYLEYLTRQWDDAANMDW